MAALVDFEHALVAPAGYGYWRTVLPLFRAGREPKPTFAPFREGYESVRPLPSGLDDRRVAWVLVVLVQEVLALDVQNAGIGPDEREQAEGMADPVSEVAAGIRDRD